MNARKYCTLHALRTKRKSNMNLVHDYDVNSWTSRILDKNLYVLLLLVLVKISVQLGGGSGKNFMSKSSPVVVSLVPLVYLFPYFCYQFVKYDKNYFCWCAGAPCRPHSSDAIEVVIATAASSAPPTRTINSSIATITAKATATTVLKPHAARKWNTTTMVD